MARVKLTAKVVDATKPKSREYSIPDTEQKGLVLRVRPSGEKTYCLLYRNGQGQRKRYTIGNVDKYTLTQARAAATQQLGKIALGTDVQEERKEARQERHTLESFITQVYAPWASANRKAGAHTARRVLRAFKSLLDLELATITPWHIEKWRSARTQDSGRRSHGNRDIACLKSVFSKAKEWGCISESPIRDVRLARQDKSIAVKIRILSPEEEARLWDVLFEREKQIRHHRASHNLWLRSRKLEERQDLDKCMFADWLRPMLTIMLHCGLRRSEAFLIQWGDVDFQTGMLIIRGEIAKSGQTRVIPLNAAALECFKAWRAQSPGADGSVVFPNPETRLPFTTITKTWHEVRKAAGLPALRLHDLRHTFCSRLLAAGADLQTVRELAGHTSISTTAIYLHSTQDRKRAAVELLGRPSNVISLDTHREGCA